MHKLRPYFPALLLFAGCVLLLDPRTQRAVPLAGPLPAIMAELNGYDVVDQVISDQERQIAGMTEYVARSYRRDSVVAFTTLVSYYDRQTQGKSIHSPRNCLPGAGWEIMNGEPRTIVVDGRAQTVNRYLLKNRSATAVAYYWYQGRGRVTSNEYAVKWNLLRDAAVFGRTEEALVRVVVPVSSKGRNQFAAGAVLPEDTTGQAIAARLMREVSAVLPRM